MITYSPLDSLSARHFGPLTVHQVYRQTHYDRFRRVLMGLGYSG
jgi:hypothetical protein